MPTRGLEGRFLAHERDERWVYVALAVLALAYIIYRYRESIDLPVVSLRSLRKLGTTAPYVLATFFGIFFQAWNRRRFERIRKKWEADLKLERSARRPSVMTGGCSTITRYSDEESSRTRFRSPIWTSSAPA